MEVCNQSKTGPVVTPLADLTTILSRQIDHMKRRLLDRLNQDAASFAQVEVEVHDRFRRLAGQMTASLLAEATIPPDRAEPEKKGCAAVPGHITLRRRGG